MEKLPAYSPKWLSQPLEGLDTLPVPFGLLSFVLVVALAVGRHLAAWQQGTLARGQFSLFLAVNGVFIFAWPLAWRKLDRLAKRAFSDFYSGARKAKLEKALEDFLSLPGLISSIIFIGSGLGGYFVYKNIAVPLNPLAASVWPAISIASFFMGNAFPALLSYRLIRQISIMRRMLRETSANIFNPGDIYAVSRYGSQVAIIVLVLSYGLILAALPGFFLTPFGYVAQTGYLLAMFVVFFAPLTEINARMRRSKQELLNEIGEDQKRISAQLHVSVNSKDFAGLGDLRNAVSALKDQRDVVLKQPTWPWQPDTLRNLLTPLLIPVIVYLVQRFLGTLFGF